MYNSIGQQIIICNRLQIFTLKFAIFRHSDDQKVINIYGPRQVGKTTFINHILETVKNKVVLNGEEAMVNKAFSSNSYQSMMEAIGNNTTLFFDEAQMKTI